MLPSISSKFAHKITLRPSGARGELGQTPFEVRIKQHVRHGHDLSQYLSYLRLYGNCRGSGCRMRASRRQWPLRLFSSDRAALVPAPPICYMLRVAFDALVLFGAGVLPYAVVAELVDALACCAKGATRRGSSPL